MEDKRRFNITENKRWYNVDADKLMQDETPWDECFAVKNSKVDRYNIRNTTWYFDGTGLGKVDGRWIPGDILWEEYKIWSIIELYRTTGGKFVCHRINCEADTPDLGYFEWHEARAFETLQEVVNFFGGGNEARALYSQAGIDTSDLIVPLPDHDTFFYTYEGKLSPGGIYYGGSY